MPSSAPSVEQPSTPSGRDAHELRSLWRELRAAVRERIEHEQFETWFRKALLVRADETSVCIAVQNRFTRDWLASHYREVLSAAVRSVFGGPLVVTFEVDPEIVVPALEPASVDPAAPSERRSPEAKIPPPDQGPGRGPEREPVAPTRAPVNQPLAGPTRLLWSSDVALNPNYRFDNFVVGPCNRFAHAASVGVSKSPGTAYNPLFLHGSVGRGKTHLLQSLCFSILEREPNTRILYLSCETFVNHFIGALENGDLQKFRNKYRNVGVLVVDDIHLLANKERTQEEFFHTFNTLYNSGKQIVLSSDSPPKEIPSLQERLVSRFNWGLVTEIEASCYETRMAILKRKSKDRGRELPDDVARLLAEHIDTNIRELEGAVTKLIGFASISNRPITTEMARELLREVFTPRPGQPSMENILRIVTAHYQLKLSDLQSRRRTTAIAYPRQIAMYLARKITRHSLEEIGSFFGGRDHSTVLYGVGKIVKQAKNDPQVRDQLALLLGELQGRKA